MQKKAGIHPFTVLAWISLTITALLFFSPAISSGYIDIVSTFAIPGTLSVFLVLTIITIMEVKQNAASMKKLVIFPVAGVCIFFVPYLVWFANLMLNYYSATIFALVLQIGVILWGWEGKSTA
jgi:hypothetical protein